MNMASHIAQEGIVKVSEVYRRQFREAKYQSDKAVRRLLQLPCVIFKQGKSVCNGTKARIALQDADSLDWKDNARER